MKRSEFRENYCDSVSSLMSAISELELWDTFDNICDDYYKDEQVNEWLRQTEDDWESVRDTLSNIPTGYDYYWSDGWVEYEGINDHDRYEISRIRDAIEDAMDGYWEEEDDEESEEDFVEEEPFDWYEEQEEDLWFDQDEFECERTFENCKNELQNIGDDEFEHHLLQTILA